MPTRDEMIRDIMAAQKAPSVPARGGSIANPTREQMIKDIMNRQDQGSEGSDPAWLGPLETATTAARSGLEGMTLGLSEPVLSGIQAGVNTIAGGGEGDGIWERLKSNYKSDVDERRKMKGEHPYADLGGQLTGGLLPAVASLGSSAAASAPSALKAAKLLDVGGNVAKVATAGSGAAISAMMPAKLAAMTNPIATGVGAIAKGAVQGGAAALGSEGVRQGVLRNTGFMTKDEAPGFGDIAEAGASWGAGLAALPQAYRAAKYLGKKGMSVALGPKVEAIDKYLANSERIKQAPSVESIKDEVDTIVIKLQDDVERGRLSVDEASQTLKGIKDNIKHVRTEASQEFSRQRHAASEALDRAQERFNDVVKGKKEALKGVRAPLELSGEVESAKLALKDQVSAGSREAYEILGQQKGSVNVKGIIGAIDDIEEKLHIGRGTNKALKSEDAASVVPRLEKMRQKLYALSDENGQIDFSTLKQVIQGIGEDMERYGNRIASSFSPTSEQALFQLRGSINSILRDVPGYSEKMKEVAELTRLLKRVNERFPDQRSTQAKIAGMARPTAKLDYDDLGALASATGKSFLGDIDEFVGAQKLLNNPRKLEAIAAQTPEAAELAKHNSRLSRMQHPDASRDFAQEMVNSSGLINDEAQAFGKLTQSQQALIDAETKRIPFRTLNQGTSQAKIEAVMRDKDPIETRRMFEKLDGQFSTNLAEKIDDRRVLDTFSKGNTNGSRNVNLFSIMGHTFGAGPMAGVAAGAAAGPIGMLVGAIGGAVVDKFGPQMAKGILDQVIKIQGTPTVQKLNQLNLPPEAKSFLSQQLSRHQFEVVRGNRFRDKSAINKLIGENELDKDSSNSSSEKQKPVSHDEAKKKFIEGN